MFICGHNFVLAQKVDQKVMKVNVEILINIIMI